MKMLFALSLYFNLENSIIKKIWIPKATPKIYTLLISMEKKH